MNLIARWLCHPVVFVIVVGFAFFGLNLAVTILLGHRGQPNFDVAAIQGFLNAVTVWVILRLRGVFPPRDGRSKNP